MGTDFSVRLSSVVVIFGLVIEDVDEYDFVEMIWNCDCGSRENENTNDGKTVRMRIMMPIVFIVFPSFG